MQPEGLDALASNGLPCFSTTTPQIQPQPQPHPNSNRNPNHTHLDDYTASLGACSLLHQGLPCDRKRDPLGEC